MYTLKYVHIEINLLSRKKPLSSFEPYHCFYTVELQCYYEKFLPLCICTPNSLLLVYSGELWTLPCTTKQKKALGLVFYQE